MKTTVNNGGNNIRRRSKALSRSFEPGTRNERLVDRCFFFILFCFFLQQIASSLLYQRRVHSLIHVCAGVMLSIGEVEILQASVRQVRSTFFYNSPLLSRSVCFQKKSVAAGE